MIKFDNLLQYTQLASGVKYSKVDNVPYLIVYFSENSSFIEDVNKLNLQPQDIRYSVVPITTIPRTYLRPEIKKQFHDISMQAYQSNTRAPLNQNILYDISYYIRSVDSTIRPTNYRSRAGMLIKSVLDHASASYPSYKKVLLYSVDTAKDMNNAFADRKIFPILVDIKDGDFSFDDLLTVSLTPSGARYRLLIKDKQFEFQKVSTYLRNIKEIDNTEEVKNVDDIIEKQDPEKNRIHIEKAAAKVIKHVDSKINEENKEKVKDVVEKYLGRDPEMLYKVSNNIASSEELSSTVVASILNKTISNPTKSMITAKKLSKAVGSDKVLKSLEKTHTDQMLVKMKTNVTSDDEIIKNSNIPKILNNVNPKHIFDKRSIDFETNLRQDITKCFGILENRDLPLKIDRLDILDSPTKKGELEASELSTVSIQLKDSFGNDHTLNIDIPKIDPKTGTFTIYGKTKCLANQMILCPISFPKKYESRFETTFSIFRIYSKQGKKYNFLKIFIASFKNLSMLSVLFYYFGLEETLKLYGISYRLSDTKPTKSDMYSCRISDTQYLYFENVNSELQKQLCNSFIYENPYDYGITEPFGSALYFEDLLQKMTGSPNTSYVLRTNFQNIVDPITVQVLRNMNLPYHLDLIIKYMLEKTVEGMVQDRNDLNNQRVRGSEVLVHLIQKQLITAYTIYRMQVLSGNKKAIFEVPRKEVLAKFMKSEIVSNMEYANPLEEMAAITRVSPVGKEIGGIPNKDAIQSDFRNVHPSYFGNIDPVDTPEGGTIGVNKQLAMGANITSARGLFKTDPISDKAGTSILSTSSAMVPFIGSDDGARLMMADSQVKQILPLKNPDPPIVMTGYESILTNNISSSFLKKASDDGIISSLTSDFIHLKYKNGKTEKISLEAIHLKSGAGRDTLSIFTPKVVKGQSVKKGQILAEGACIKDGSIALGRTMLTAYLDYDGYCYEDGIVVNENIIKDEKLVSLHAVVEEILVSEKDRILEIAQVGKNTEPGEVLIRKTIGEIEELLGYEEDENTTVLGQELIRKSPGGIIVDMDVYCNTDISKFPLLKELSERTKLRRGIVGNEKFSIKGKHIKGVLVTFKIQQEININIGDKMTGRHGNKGVICRIEKDEMMPKVPFGDKLVSVDIMINPLGVINRMNPGQMFEMYCGLIAKDMAVRISKAKSKSEIVSIFKNILPLLDRTDKKEYSKSVIDGIQNMGERQFMSMVSKIKKDGFVPIIVPSFSTPTPGDIMNALKVCKLKTGYNLYLPKYNLYTKEKVAIGYSYFNKLEHIGDFKLHARSTGPMTAKTNQPTSGKKHSGGQRVGELDSYALLSYNAMYVLSELMGSMSDDVISKNEIISDIITQGSAQFRYPKVSPARDLLSAYFIQMMLAKREMGE
jgi:DNA-directed RNA polymerase beta subunit